MCDKEIVVCAAIWVQDDKKRLYQPTNIPSGTVFCGLRHPSILSQLAAYGIAHKNRSVQGFLTSKNRFLTREDASEERNAYHMITKQDIQVAASYIFRSSFVSEDQARKAMVKAGNNATKILVKTFRGKLFKKAFERARRGKDISSFERQEKESGFNFLHNPNNGRMQSGHIIIDGIGLFKQIIHER